MSSRVVVVIGTRPEAIKLAPVADALGKRGIAPALIFSGQHPKLDAADFGLGRYSAIRHSCAGQLDPYAHVGMVSRAIAATLAQASPRLVIVQGDTSTALGGALAAKIAGIAVAHVEAGLRSHDPRRPWPEEEFRVAIDAQADLLFAPTELSAANLRRERVRGRIHVTGNTGIDAALAARRCVQAGARGAQLPRLLVTCHRRENWSGGLDGVAAALRMIASEGIASVDVILHPNPSLCARLRELLAEVPGIGFREPCGHSEALAEMLCADLVLSDSGGIQEEATALGVPLLVLREMTERPEAIACGNVELVGTDSKRIVAAVRRWLIGASPPAPALPFGDGRAGERIAAIVDQWLCEQRVRATSEFSTSLAKIVDRGYVVRG